MSYVKPSQYQGAIFVNLVVIAVMVGVIFAIFLPQAIDAKVRTDLNNEEIVVSRVKSGISNFYAKNLRYPVSLDNAGLGSARPDNRFFTEVLRKGVANGWSKISNNYYRLVRNSACYYYNNRTGDFREF